MFNTTLTDEYLVGQKTWQWSYDLVEQLVLNAVDATLLPEIEKKDMRHKFEKQFETLTEDQDK